MNRLMSRPMTLPRISTGEAQALSALNMVCHMQIPLSFLESA